MSRPPLSRDRVVDAASRVADASGLAGVSMRSVGRELGVEAMSLYHHVAGKEALLDGLADWVFARIDAAAVGHGLARGDGGAGALSTGRARRPPVGARAPRVAALPRSGHPRPPRRGARLPALGGLLRRARRARLLGARRLHLRVRPHRGEPALRARRVGRGLRRGPRRGRSPTTRTSRRWSPSRSWAATTPTATSSTSASRWSSTASSSACRRPSEEEADHQQHGGRPRSAPGAPRGLTAYGVGQRTLLLRAGGDPGAVAGGVDELAEPVLDPVDVAHPLVRAVPGRRGAAGRHRLAPRAAQHRADAAAGRRRGPRAPGARPAPRPRPAGCGPSRRGCASPGAPRWPTAPGAASRPTTGRRPAGRRRPPTRGSRRRR